jgi:hypothetical protein
VFIPFDTQYKFLIKNQNDCRIRVEISIDGANVSGGGLILDKGDVDYIERFVDVDRKFKFVKADNDAVADPTNPSNGDIIVTVHRERKEYKLYAQTWGEPFYRKDPWCSSELKLGSRRVEAQSMNLGASGGASDILRGMQFTCSTANTSTPTSASSIVTDGTLQCSASSSFGYVPVEEKGATVEGALSNQVFGFTHWAGNAGMPSIFSFRLRPQVAKETEPEFLISVTLHGKSMLEEMQVAFRSRYDGYNPEVKESRVDPCTCPHVFTFSVSRDTRKIEVALMVDSVQYKDSVYMHKALDKICDSFDRDWAKVF